MYLEDNNVNSGVAEKREIFLQAEKEYLEELMKNPNNREFIKSLNQYSALNLSKEADRRICKIENGEVKPENLERVEAEIALIYAAIQDKIKKLEKELDHFNVNKERQKTKEDEFEK